LNNIPTSWRTLDKTPCCSALLPIDASFRTHRGGGRVGRRQQTGFARNVCEPGGDRPPPRNFRWKRVEKAGNWAKWSGNKDLHYQLGQHAIWYTSCCGYNVTDTTYQISFFSAYPIPGLARPRATPGF